MDPIHQLPELPFKAIRYSEIFFLLSVIKVLNEGYISPKFYFKKSFKLIVFILIVSVIVTLYFGISSERILYFIRHISPWLYIFIIPQLLKKEEDYYSFFNLIYGFLIFVIVVQVIHLVVGIKPAFLLGGKEIWIKKDVIRDSSLNEYDVKELVRPVYSASIILIATFSSMYDIWRRRLIKYSETYPSIILFLAFFSILLGGTRGWIMSFLVLIFLTLTTHNRTNKGRMKTVVVILLLVLILSNIPFVKNQTIYVFDRFNFFSEWLSDSSNSETGVARIDSRIPRVWSQYVKSPFFGFGFSDIYSEYNDGHTGNYSILLNIGIVGYILFLVSISIFIGKNYLMIKKQNNEAIKQLFSVPIIFFIFLFAINGTSRIIFSYTLEIHYIIALSIFLNYSNLLYKKYKRF